MRALSLTLARARALSLSPSLAREFSFYTVAIGGPPEKCFCRDRCTRNDVEHGPCTDDHPDEPPHVICKASPQLYPPHSLPTTVP